MANFNHSYKTESQVPMIDYLFYFALILLSASVVSFVIFNFKAGLQYKIMDEVEKKSLSLGAGERQAYNKKILDYKEKIDDFATIIDNHKITSSIFRFIEENTISNVWFSSFNMQKSADEIRLSGESENIEALSQQVKIFEGKKNFVRGISVLSSQANSVGRVSFVLNILLDSQIFNYRESSFDTSFSN